MENKQCQNVGCGRPAVKQVTLGNGRKQYRGTQCSMKKTPSPLGMRTTKKEKR